MAESHHSSLVTGVVSQSRLSQLPGLIHFTPGVKSAAAGDNLGQRYVGAEEAVLDRGADVIIVGRGVTAAGVDGAAEAAQKYRDSGWRALEKRIRGDD